MIANAGAGLYYATTYNIIIHSYFYITIHIIFCNNYNNYSIIMIMLRSNKNNIIFLNNSYN